MASRLRRIFRLQNFKLAWTYWLIAYFILAFLNIMLWIFVSPVSSLISTMITTPILITFIGLRYLRTVNIHTFHEGIKIGLIWFVMSIVADISLYVLIYNRLNNLSVTSEYSYWFIVPYLEVLAGGIVAGLIKNINNWRMKND